MPHFGFEVVWDREAPEYARAINSDRETIRQYFRTWSDMANFLVELHDKLTEVAHAAYNNLCVKAIIRTGRDTQYFQIVNLTLASEGTHDLRPPRQYELDLSADWKHGCSWAKYFSDPSRISEKLFSA